MTPVRYEPQRQRPARVERKRLLRALYSAKVRHDEAEVQRLEELDSELFDVTEHAPTMWRDDLPK